MNTENSFRTFKQKLDSLNRKIVLIKFVSALLVFTGLAFLILFTAVILESLFYFSKTTKIYIDILIFTGLATSFFYAFRHLIIYIFFIDKDVHFKSIARRIGDKYPKVKDRLLNAFEIYSQKEHLKKIYSPSLIENVVERDINPYLKYDFNVVLNRTDIRKNGIRLLSLTIIIALITIPFYDSFGNAFGRLINPSKNAHFSIPDITVYPGNTSVIYGDSLKIKIDTENLENLTLFIKKESQFNYDKVNFSDKDYEYQINNIKEPVNYYVTGEKKITELRSLKTESDKYRIKVITRPIVKVLRAEIKYPSYTGIEETTLEENIGDIFAIKGSSVELKFVSNKTIQQAFLDFETGKDHKFDVFGNKGQVNFKVKENDRYKIILQDTSGIFNSNPIEYRITATYDELPFIEIITPGKNVDLADDLLLPLSFKIGDDFGISSLWLFYTKIYEENKGDAEIPPKNTFDKIEIPLKDFSGMLREVYYNWDMNSLKLLPSNKVFYYAAVYDNDRVSGFKKAESEIYYARVPSMYELYEEVEKEQEKNIVDLEKVYEEGKKFKETLEKLNLEIKKSREIDWEKKKALKDAAKKKDELMEKVDKIEKNLQKLAQKLNKNNLTAEETLKKYFELQKILDEIKSPELKKALKELRESIDKFNKDKAKSEMDKMVMDQEEFLRKIERTLSILKHIKKEQQLDELVKKVEELVKRENEVLNKLKDKDTDLNNLAKKQDKIGKDIDNFETDFEDIRKEMMTEPLMPQQLMDNISEQLKKEQLGKLSSETRTNIQVGNKDAASKQGQHLRNNLEEIKNDLQMAKDRMVNNFKQKVLNEFRKITYDLLSLSEIQEGLRNRTAEMKPNSPSLTEVAEKQLDAMSALNRTANNMLNLSNETFFVTPEMGKAVSYAMIEMRSGLNMFEERNPTNSARHQSNALANLNKAVMEINSAMNSIKKSESGGGLEEYLKRLAEMAKKQEGINKATIKLPTENRLKIGERGQAERLAYEQEMLRKTLEQLQKEMGKRSEILGDMKKIAEDMKKVSEELKNADIDNRTLKRQERILSRLLDAQRSLHQRDYSRKRLAETAQDYDVVDPCTLPEDLGEKDAFFREKLQNAIKEGYSKDYIELIRKYFEKIKEIEFKKE